MMARLLTLILLLSLSACGYHLRGALQLPAEMQATRITGIELNEPLAVEIIATLEGSGGGLAVSREEAQVELQVLGEELLKRTTAVNSRGLTGEYELNLRVTFALRRADGSVWLEPQTVGVVRRFAFDSSQVLGKTAEEELLRREMRRDVVRLMFGRLQALARQQAATEVETPTEVEAAEPGAEPEPVQGAAQ